ncbi:MAG: PhpK family radical SAM P-methyltransferase [Clostridia bacterium]|nr:PhpK family radical SAM P-methyltransferase [Clostridia bacterium]
MSEVIDCLFIGFNEMNFEDYEKRVKLMGVNSGAYRDLNLSFIQYENKPYTASGIYNLFNLKNNLSGDGMGPMSVGNTLNTTIAYLGTYLNRRGLSFDYINSFQDEKDELASKLKTNNILTIAIPTALYVSVFPILEIMSFIKKHNRTAKVIIGGPFVANNISLEDNTALQYLFKNIGADFYIYSSQGEAALTSIIGAVKNKESYDGLFNVFYKSGSSYAATPLVDEKVDLEENPTDWSLFRDKIGKSAWVRTALSCPFSCSFCEYPQRAGKYRTISVEAVERELNILDSIGKVKSVGFVDDTFNVPPERFKEILRMMIRNKYSFNWFSYFRCQYADRETVELMKESGCEGVLLGIESGNNNILQNMNKAVTIEQYQRGLELLNEYGIISEASFIVGFLGETLETVQDTVRFIEESKPTFFRAQAWYCSSLAPIWKEKSKYNIKGMGFEWAHETMDSVTATNLVEDMFVSVKNSIWAPQHYFDFPGILNLKHRGFDMEEIKKFLSTFNEGVKEKLKNPKQGNVSSKIAEELKMYANIRK